MNTQISIEGALETFLIGFTTTRNFTKPFRFEELAAGVWAMGDVEATKKDAGTPEVVVFGALIEDVKQSIRAKGLQKHSLCVLILEENEISMTIERYEKNGYRLLGTEGFFTLNLEERVGKTKSEIRRVCTAADAEAVAKAGHKNQLLPEHLTTGNSICRLYAAFDGTIAVGWVSSIRTHPERSWVSNLFVSTSYRKRGIGHSLMSFMLEEDTKYGVRHSVLLASAEGAKLYPKLGYRNRGTALLFAPKEC